MTAPIRAALERLIARIEETHNPNDPVPAWFGSYFAARAALAEPLPPKVGHIQRLADIIEECQPKTPYAIAATALAQAILSHPDIGLVLGNSDGPAVLEGREPAFVAGEPSNEEFRQLYCDIFDLRCDPASLGPVPVKFARAVIDRWGHQPARLRNCPTHGQQPPEAWGCPECVRELREELAAALTAKQTPPAEGELSLKELDHRPKLSADDIPPGPFSEHELREQWNQQADEFNQWDSLDSCEQLAWAQARAIQRDRNAKPTPPAVTISALLRPAYEPGDGSADCAQMGNGQWKQMTEQNTNSISHAEWNAKDLAEWLTEEAKWYYSSDKQNEVLHAAANLLQQQQAEIQRLKDELADERMRLSACFKIAICDTPETAIRARYEYREHYWSPAAEAIAQKIDELIRLRKRFSEEAGAASAGQMSAPGP